MARPKGLRAGPVDLLLSAGVLCLMCSALGAAVARNLVDPKAFAVRTAQSLSDPRVARFAADQLVQSIVATSPDLVGVRPLLLGTAEGIVSSKPFAIVVRRAALEAHRQVFSAGGRGIMMSAPDLEILIRQGLDQTNPQLAAKIPAGLRTVLANMHGHWAEVLVNAWRSGHRIRLLARIGGVVGFLLLGLGIGLARDRTRAVARGGSLLIVGSVLLGSLLPLGSLAIASTVKEPLARGALQGLWQTYLGELFGWALFIGGLGVLCAGAATSLLDRLQPQVYLQAALRTFLTPPKRKVVRTAWALGLVAIGLAAVLIPRQLVIGSMIVSGILVALIGIRELFLIILASVDLGEEGSVRASHGRLWLRPAIATVLALGLAVGWILLRRPHAGPVATPGVCNGHSELCGRRVDEVAFAAAHNAMSNASIADWMFPHQQVGIPAMLADGIRALMIDVHYGFPGGERIKTDIEGEGHAREMMVGALGEESTAAAQRIRDRLVGVDEGKRGLYLCHGFCELGAYELLPTLHDIHTFLVEHPEEVLLIIIEDYVSPAEIADAFSESGLADLVYEGPSGPPWPTLGELVDSNRRVIVFLESGRTDVPWLRPVIKNIQETPYSFHSPAEFSSKPNRGGTEGSLFLVNHWIESTPTPKPSNAAIVNARDVLLPRVIACEKQRHHLPNIVAVDFYQTGDLMAVVDELNGFKAAPAPPR